MTSDWQTMDSAPKGRLVLLAFDSHPVTIGRFEYGVWVYAFCLTEGGENPTHWMPLPPAPSPPDPIPSHPLQGSTRR